MWFATAVGGLVVVGVVWAGIKQYHVKVMMPKDYKDAVENANSPDGSVGSAPICLFISILVCDGFCRRFSVAVRFRPTCGLDMA